MDKANIFRRFNMFNSQSGSIQEKIQGILYYAESRFWFILNHLRKGPELQHVGGQKLLHRELVNPLSQLITLMNLTIYHSHSSLFYHMSE